MTKQIKRLAKRMCDRGVVPFVGAGFSYGARHDNDWHTTPSHMSDLLRKKLKEVLPAHPCDPPGRTLRDEFKKAGDSLARLAEIACLVMTPREVCDELRIAEYAELKPLASHRYLAYLAREGLVQEVITTNYDCCIETAFRESFDGDRDRNSALGVVTDLASYRAKAAKHATAGHLLLYKVNGCARAYRDRKDDGTDLSAWDRAADRIILTERQLQSFRQEHWARDLFRDRARSRSFLFSGFGSEEPQIRHTALNLIEEFSRIYSKRRPEEAMDLPNAPFIHTHGSTLSFYQLQIMVAFLGAHSGPVLSIEPIFSNVISPCAEQAKLCASTFMRKLYAHVFYKLVMREIEEGVALRLWLREHALDFRMWLDAFRRRVIDEVNGKTWDALFAPAEQGSPFPMTLQRRLWFMCNPGRPLPITDWYLPLREDPLFVLLTLLLVMILELRTDAAFGGDIPIDDDRERPLCIRLVHERALQTREPLPPTHPSRLVRVIAIPSHRAESPVGRVISYQPAASVDGIRTIIVGQWSAVRLGDVIKAAEGPAGLRAAIRKCAASNRRHPMSRLVPVPLAKPMKS